MSVPPRKDDSWGIGQMSDGSINSMTLEEASIAKAERDAFETAFQRMLDGDDPDDLSDLDNE